MTSQSGGSDRVTLTNDAGTSAIATIPGGVEVEIVAWRPRRGATRYRVISTDGRLEGWVGAASLKACPAPAPVKRAEPVVPPKQTLPIRGARTATPRPRSTPGPRSTPVVAEGATIKTVSRTSKSTRIGTR